MNELTIGFIVLSAVLLISLAITLCFLYKEAQGRKKRDQIFRELMEMSWENDDLLRFRKCLEVLEIPKSKNDKIYERVSDITLGLFRGHCLKILAKEDLSYKEANDLHELLSNKIFFGNLTTGMSNLLNGIDGKMNDITMRDVNKLPNPSEAAGDLEKQAKYLESLEKLYLRNFTSGPVKRSVFDKLYHQATNWFVLDDETKIPLIKGVLKKETVIELLETHKLGKLK